MKKLIFIITILFMGITIVYADDNLLINDLKINNATISPKFNQYNNYYSVTIDENTDKLDFDYDFNKDKYEVKITNNENLVENKLIYVTVYNKESKEKNTYIFKIYLEEVITTVKTVDNEEDTINKDKKTTNYAPVIGTLCFLLIIFVYYVIFLR